MNQYKAFLELFLKQNSNFELDDNALVNFEAWSYNLIEAQVDLVTDGDGVRVVTSEKMFDVRLFAIDSPEHDQEWGDNSKYGLIKLIGGKDVFLETHGFDPHGRTLATIYVLEDEKLINVNERMVSKGHAWVYRKFYGELSRQRRFRLDWLVNRAKENKIGLWKLKNPIPPWNWRNKKSA